MNATTLSILSTVTKHLEEIENSKSFWEPRFDVLSSDIAERVDDIVTAPPTDLAGISAICEFSSGSFREDADTSLSVACWLYLHGKEETRKMLLATLAPRDGVRTLLAHMSGRFFSRFESGGELLWARFALTAISLLGDYAEYRDDSLFVARVRKELQAHGYDPGPVLREFADISVGTARSVFSRDAH